MRENTARRTAVEITFDGADITSSIRPYLKSLTYTDNEEDETDELRIQLHDREGVWMEQWLRDAIEAAASSSTAASDEILYTVVKGDTLSEIAAKYHTTYPVLAKENGIKNPNLIYPGQIIRIPGTDSVSSAAVSGGFSMEAMILPENGNRSTVLPCGVFELDSISASGPPSVIEIKGTSLPFSAQIRQTKKSKAWVACSLSDIAKTIAEPNGMVCMYLSEADPYYTRVEQLKTSDIQFLETLCHNAGLSLKATNHILVLFDQADYESRASVLTIRRGEGTYTKYKLNVGTADTQYASCRVSYVSPSGACISATAKVEDYNEKSKNNQQLEITAKVANTNEAKALAEKLLRKHNRYAKTATFTMPGDPALVAGVTVKLEGWGLWDGIHLVTQARHTVGSSGYTVQIKLRRGLEGY